jgi:LacI family trehalose operon transcriptional repressor
MPGVASVCYDDEGAIFTLMQRLYDQGHRHISFLGVPHATSPPASVAMRPIWRFAKSTTSPPPPCRAGHEAGLRAGRQRADAETTALVCATDTLALGASKYLQEQRIDNCRSRASAARR